MAKSLRALALAIAVIVALPSMAKATLNGDDVAFELLVDDANVLGPVTKTVGAGHEFDLGFEGVSFMVNVNASSIDFELFGGSLRFIGKTDFIFTDLDFSGGDFVIVGVVLNAIQGIGNVSFTADSVTFSLSDGEDVFGNGVFASIKIITRRAEVATRCVNRTTPI